MAAAAEAAGETEADADNRYWRQLATVTATGPFPAVRELLAGFADEPEEPDDPFAFGLERILDGIAVLVERRRAG